VSGLDERSFWPRVQGHLDARLDPLDDPEVQRFLLDNPEFLEEFAELQDGLRTLRPDIGPAGGAGRRRKLPWTAAAALLCALGLLWLLQPDNGDLPPPDIARGGRVLLLDITTVLHDHETRTEKRINRGNYVHRAVETVTYLNPDNLASLEITRTKRYSE
jgi:hypothetical protein